MTTAMSAIDDYMSEAVNIIGKEIFRSLAFLGEKCNKRIRDRSESESWINHTSNLRSSIGYAIYARGEELIRSAFDIVGKGTEGPSAGKELIAALASTFSDTYTLVVVAGMSYAEFVEAHDNKDVLASTQLWAEKECQKYLDIAKKRAIRRIERLAA